MLSPAGRRVQLGRPIGRRGVRCVEYAPRFTLRAVVIVGIVLLVPVARIFGVKAAGGDRAC